MNVNSIISEIIRLLKSRITKDSAIVLSGNVLGAGLGFLATVIITRTLGPAKFGLFSVALAIMTIASQISDFGISTGLVRYAALYLQNDKLKAGLVFKVAFKIKLISAMVIFLLGFFTSGLLAVNVFGKPELAFSLKLAFIGAFGVSLVSYITSSLQARQNFKKFTTFRLIIPIGKSILIGLLFFTNKLSLLNAFTIIIVLPFISLLIGSLIIPKDFLRAKGDEKKSFMELFHFSKWILVSTICVIIFNRIDILMLEYFKSSDVVGYYSAAYKFAFVFPLITGTITSVLLPKVSELDKKDQLREYTKKALKFTTPIILPLIVLLFISRPVILCIYGGEYLPSIIVFQILICSFALSIVINPISLIIYSLNKPKILAYLNIIQLVSNFLVNLLLIPSYGAVGAAIATLLVRVIGTIFIGVYVYCNIMKKN